MEQRYITLRDDNLQAEHLCCAIADKKHQAGVAGKKAWIKNRLLEGHVMRKLDAKAKVFIEYAPVDSAWAPVEGEGFVYIYCLWVSGQYKGQGHARRLLEGCIQEAREKEQKGLCVITGKKKKPFHTDASFFAKFGFEVADTLPEGYQLMALPFGEERPRFTQAARSFETGEQGLVIYHSPQCPYIADCLRQAEAVCQARGIAFTAHPVTSAQEAKAVPCVFNNWAVFYGGRFVTTHLLNEGYLAKMLDNLKGA